MGELIQPADLAFFSTLFGAGSLSAAARELGVTTPAVSKRLALIEQRLGLRLVVRSTRRMSLTPEGELLLERARAILSQIDDLQQQLSQGRGEPRGLLRVNATLGFGRSYVAPLISRFVRRYPQVEVQLQLSVNPPALTDDAYDVGIRFGQPPESRVIARRLAVHRRLLCAAPAYLADHGAPQEPADLQRHACITIRQGDEAYGVWRFTREQGRDPGRYPGRERQASDDIPADQQTVRVRGPLSTNDGEIAVRWVLDGHGILLRSEWDIARYLKSGALQQVLPGWQTPEADIYAVYPQSLQWSARVQAFVGFMVDAMRPQLG